MTVDLKVTEGEIQILDYIVQAILRGHSSQMAARHKEFASLARKVIAAKTSVTEKLKEQKKG